MSESEHTTDGESEELHPDAAADIEDIEAALEDEGIDVESGAESAESGGLMSFLGSGGIEEMLQRDTFHDEETGVSFSQADLVADVINIMRMDAKQMARIHGINVSVDKMSPERAAELLAAVAKNDGIEIITVFEKIENKRDHVFKQELSEEEYEQYQEFKRGMLYSVGEGDS